MSKNSELNQLVLKYQANKAAGIRPKQSDVLKIYNLAMELTERQHGVKYADVDFGYVLMVKALSNYKDTNGDFANYLSTILKHEMIDQKKKTAKHSAELVMDNDENYERSKLEADPESKDKMHEYETNQSARDMLEGMLNIVRVRQDKLKNSPKICWETYFFTENVTNVISANSFLYSYVSSNSERYMSVISMDFANSYMAEECSTFEDISKTPLKTEDYFLGNESQKPCGYELVLEVYAAYTGKTIQAAHLKRKEYRKMMQEKLT